MKTCIIFDIDGILKDRNPECNPEECQQVYIEKTSPTLFKMIEYYMTHPNDYDVFVITRKKEVRRQSIQNYIHSIFIRNPNLYNVNNISKSFTLFMRAENESRKSIVLKKEIYDNYIKGKYDIIFAIDDDVEVCKMWNNEGIEVFEVDKKLNKKVIKNGRKIYSTKCNY